MTLHMKSFKEKSETYNIWWNKSANSILYDRNIPLHLTMGWITCCICYPEQADMKYSFWIQKRLHARASHKSIGIKLHFVPTSQKNDIVLKLEAGTSKYL